MSKKPTPVPDDKEQAKQFIETAKEIGVDQTGKTFEEAMKKIPVAPHKNQRDK